MKTYDLTFKLHQGVFEYDFIEQSLENVDDSFLSASDSNVYINLVRRGELLTVITEAHAELKKLGIQTTIKLKEVREFK